MNLYILKHPNPSTLIARSYGDTCPEGYEPSTEEAAAAWEAEQIAAGWEPTIVDTPSTPPVPAEIANWRAKAVLEISGLLTQVEQALTTLTGPEAIVARNAWESGAPLARRGPTVTALAASLGLTDEQVDAMFVQAMSLEV